MNITKNIQDLKLDALRNRNTGTVAWLLHRITGLLLVLYICLHLCVLGSNLLFGTTAFNTLMATFTNPLVKLLEIGLIGCIGFHLLNGLRVIFADFFELTRAHRVFFWLVAVLLVLILVVTFIVFFFVHGVQK